jgi:type IV pilus biogenesis protein CpaD/CtpE
MYKYTSKSVSTILLLMTLPLAGCVADNMFADETISPYGGSKQHPIKVANGRASVEGCGDWSENVADTVSNDLSPNHGCAVQANIAAMAAYPADLTGKGHHLPRPLGFVQQYAIDKVTAPAAGNSSSSGSSSGGGSSSSGASAAN